MSQKNKKSKKQGGKGTVVDSLKNRELVFKETQEEYAKVTGLLGDRKLSVTLTNGSETMAIIPGKMRKKCWIAVDDILLVSLRDFQTNKVDVIYKYTAEEVNKLITYLEMPSSFIKPSDETANITNNEGEAIVFCEDDEIEFSDI